MSNLQSPKKRRPRSKSMISNHIEGLQTGTVKKALARKDEKEEEIAIDSSSYLENKDETFVKKVENATSIFLIILEQVITSITLILPPSLINACTYFMKIIFSFFKSNNSTYNEFINDKEFKGDEVLLKVEKLRNAKNFKQICELNGFEMESHLVHTQDGYHLTIHRLNPEGNGFKPNGEIVYLQHGLLMTSDVWCIMLNKSDNLPFRLCELGYDVYLGNNRGNKYSSKHSTLDTNDKEFWNFSIDEFAMYDMPSSINYILNLKNAESLIYIGFSQGCSQILSSVSINNDLNDKISKLILIGPATTPKKLSNWLINSIINFEPELIYSLFGRKILMKSVMFWRNITYPPMFVKLIDIPNKILFDWKSFNIDIIQKLISYYHLYSTTSVKCVVHWFQIIKSKKFQMYRESDLFEPFEYQTDTAIKIPKICIIYGMSDSLVDIDILADQLPEFDVMETVHIKNAKVIGKKTIGLSKSRNKFIDSNDQDNNCVNKHNNENDNYKVYLGNETELKVYGIENYEHLDLLWGKNMEANVIRNVLNFLPE